jgi:hypothetical protein
MNNVTPEKIRQVLALDITGNDAGAATVREYLLRLLSDVWREEESFDGKRPFGNSGWKEEIYRPLIAAGLMTGLLGKNGFIWELDEDTADELILACIAALDVN